MAISRTVEPKDIFVGRLKHGADLLEELTSFCREKQIRLGKIQALGALKRARLAFYNQSTRKYEFHDFDQPLEITALVGNVSIKDGEPIIHAHVTLSDDKSAAFGGHLAPGTIVFACEFTIEVFQGEDLIRGMDDETGLPLWENI